MAKLAPITDDQGPPFWSHWQANMQAMAALRAPETFWDWPAVRHTMTVDHFPMGAQLAALKAAPDWPRWDAALSHLENEHHARNMINQAWCLFQWESVTRRRVEELDSIYEFGGGYGALAHLCARLGFVGRYSVTDLPEFALLQDWWLGTHGLAVEHVPGPVVADLAVALYSLSETPTAYRREIDAALVTDSYLMLYSGRWAEWDNHSWMRDFIAARSDKIWTVTQYLERPDWFAIGR